MRLTDFLMLLRLYLKHMHSGQPTPAPWFARDEVAIGKPDLWSHRANISIRSATHGTVICSARKPADRGGPESTDTFQEQLAGNTSYGKVSSQGGRIGLIMKKLITVGQGGNVVTETRTSCCMSPKP